MATEGEQKESIIDSIEDDQDLLLSSSEPETEVKEEEQPTVEAEDKEEPKTEEVVDTNDNEEVPKEPVADVAEVVEPTPVNEPELEPVQPEFVEETTPQAPESPEPTPVAEPPVVEEKKAEEESKDQTRLKKLEEARKKIERLKNKKNINNQQSKESTPVVEETISKVASAEKSPTIGNDKVIELNRIITSLNNTIKDKDAEILKLKAELTKERQLNKDLTKQQTQNTTSISMSPLTVSYEPVDFNKWKNYTIDMSEWRSIGSGPIVQF